MTDPIYWITGHIERLKPGEHVVISGNLIRDIRLMPWCDDPADQIMGNVVGSAYEVMYWRDLMNWKREDVTFRRLIQPVSGEWRTWVYPDRRHLYEQVEGGLWKLRKDPLPEPPPRRLALDFFL